MTSKETFNYLRKLLKDTYSGGDHRNKEEMGNIRSFLFTRAWIIISIFVTTRILVVMSGRSDWQTVYKEANKHEGLNQRFIDQTEPYVIGAGVCLLVLRTLVCIFAYKRRNLARYLIYLRLLASLSQQFLP